jgi:MFS family permease
MSAALLGAPVVARRRAPLYGWLTAQVVSATGTRLSLIAVPWFVLTTTGSATRTGLVAFAEMAPYVLVKALGGPLLDRLGARRVSIVCDLLSVAAVGAVPLLYAAGWLPFPALLVLVALMGTLRGPGDGAKQALVPGVSALSGAPVERVTGLANASDRLAGLTGAAIGGVLIAAFGAPFALTIDALSFGLAALLIGLTAPRSEGGGPAGAGYRADLRAGWAFVRGDRVLLAITLMVGLTNLLDQAYFTVLLPAWALHGDRGSEAVGLLLAVSSAGAVTGSMLAAAVSARMPRYLTFVVAFLLAGAPRFVALGLDFPLVVVLFVAVVGGFASGFLNPILGAVMIERIPPALYGRVSSLSSAFCWALMPFGGLVAGWLIAGLSLDPALIICGVAYLAFTGLPLLMPGFREFDRR